MTASEITRYRLHNQQIAAARLRQPAAVVARMGAIQAQDYPGAKWSIGLRLPGSTDAVIERAIADRSLVRTWPMRGTLHFIAAADIRWMLELLTPRVIAASGSRQKQLGLDDTIFNRCKEAFVQTLQGGAILTRDEMYQTLEGAGIPTDGQRGYHILWRTAQDGLICFGPPEGKEQTFVLVEEWLPGAKRRERSDALAELSLRYFTGHGPATLHDFAWWANLSAAEAKTGLESVKDRLIHDTFDGKTYWMPPDTVTPPDAAPRLYLLPGFDEYMLGYRDRSAALDPAHAQKIVPGSNGVFMPTLVIDGRVAGIWKRAIRKNDVTVTAHPFAPITESEERAIEIVAHRYRQFLGYV